MLVRLATSITVGAVTQVAQGVLIGQLGATAEWRMNVCMMVACVCIDDGAFEMAMVFGDDDDTHATGGLPPSPNDENTYTAHEWWQWYSQ